jgi:hypothetical protein
VIHTNRQTHGGDTSYLQTNTAVIHITYRLTHSCDISNREHTAVIHLTNRQTHSGDTYY